LHSFERGLEERIGGEKEVKKAVILMAAPLMVLAMLAAPVLAIGPFGGAEANDNDSLGLIGAGVTNFRGDGKPMGFNSWILSNTGNWIEWRLRDAQYANGIMNTAIVAHRGNINPVFLGGPDNQNTWIYLSGDGGDNADQFAVTVPPYPNLPLYTYAQNNLGSHGTLFWMFYFVMGSSGGGTPQDAATLASAIAEGFPEGAFYRYNIVTAAK
jgi:hypothetical protein